MGAKGSTIGTLSLWALMARGVQRGLAPLGGIE